MEKVTTHKSIYNLQKEIDLLCSKVFRDLSLSEEEKGRINITIKHKMVEIKAMKKLIKE